MQNDIAFESTAPVDQSRRRIRSGTEIAAAVAGAVGAVTATAALGLAGDGFLKGIVIESTTRAEARAQVADAAFGSALGALFLAAIAVAIAVFAALYRRSTPVRIAAIVVSFGLSFGAATAVASADHQLHRATCRMQFTSATCD